MRTSLTRVLMLVPAAVLLAACSASVSVGDTDTDSSLSQSDVEDQVTSELVDGGGPEDGEVTCPGDLEGEVGTTMSCRVESPSDPDSRARVDLEVTEVDGSDVGFDYSVAPLVSPELVEQQVSDGLTEQVGQAPDDVTCPDDLEAAVGQSTTCLITAGEDTLDVEATISAIEDSTINFDIQVADAVN